MTRLRKLLIPLVIVTTVALAGCANTKPTASEWSAKFIEICTRDSSDREAIAERIFSSSAKPTVEQFMAFEVEYAPIFEAAIIRYKALDRPSGLDTEINEFFAAADSAANSTRTNGSDRAAAELDFANDPSPVWIRVQAAASALGLDKCNQ